MLDLQLLKDRGIDYEGLKKLLAPDDKTSKDEKSEPKNKSEKIARLKQIIRQRIQSGREQCIANAKHYHAIDLAWETPRRQVSTTLLNSLMDKTSTQSIDRTLESWGFDLKQVLEEVVDGKTGKVVGRKVSVPAFHQVFVPLVKAYVSIRCAKLMNDRKRVPFRKFEPAVSTTLSRMQCEVLTARLEMTNQHYDHWTTYRQATLQMLLYGSCHIFPREEWHEECQETNKEDKFSREADWEDNEAKNYEPGKEGEKKKRYERVQKEGIRYKTPHPSRVFSDEAHAPSTYNTDTGCEYSGYWEVVRFRDIRNNPKFYNKDKVSIGASDWWTRPSTQVFFATVYNTCTISPPVVQSESTDRETRMADSYYSAHYDDSSVVVTNYFQKLVPSEFGLGDYDYPVWFRFVVATDDTILYAAPIPYAPTQYMGYDADELRASAANSSLALECLPFQDQFSNLMTQYLLSVRQNLVNVTFVDTAQVGPKWLEKLKQVGRKLAELNWIPYEPKNKMMGMNDVTKAFQSFRFPPLDTNGIIQAMKVVLDTLERVLVMSSQEVAQAATHEQTREEIRDIRGSTSTRLTATGIPIDLAMEAGKRQWYYGQMAYGEDEMYAQVPLDRALTPDVKEGLKKLGFTFEEDDMDILKAKRLNVKVPKKALMLESFASSRDGEERTNSVEAGTAMLQTLVGLLGSQLYPNIGPDQFLTLINLSAQLMGYPREFKLQNMGGWDGDVMGQMQQMLQQLQQAMRQETQQGMVPVLDAIKQTQAGLGQVTEGMEKTFESQEHKIKDVAQRADSRQKDLERDQKSLAETLNRILKQLDTLPRLPQPTPIIAPNAQINVGPGNGDASGSSEKSPTLVTTA